MVTDSSMSLENKQIVMIGGTSGMGLATAKAAIAQALTCQFATGAQVTIASRSPEKLTAAQTEIGGNVSAQPIDLMQEDSIREFFQTVGVIDHLVIHLIQNGYMTGAVIDVDGGSLAT